MRALAAAAEILRAAGDTAMAQTVEDRLHNLQKKKLEMSAADRVFLRSRMLERRDTRTAAQAAAKEDDKRFSILKEEAKIQKAKADQEKGQRKTEARKAAQSASLAARAAKIQSDEAKITFGFVQTALGRPHIANVG